VHGERSRRYHREDGEEGLRRPWDGKEDERKKKRKREEGEEERKT
jgi:hypothetical protein